MDENFRGYLPDCIIHSIIWIHDRSEVITPAFERKLYTRLDGICRDLKYQALRIGGTGNHIHLLNGVNMRMSVEEFLKTLISRSQEWVRSKVPGLENFRWSESTGSFTISKSEAPQYIRYIAEQKQHHEKQTFEEEFIGILDSHNIDYDPEHLWD